MKKIWMLNHYATTEFAACGGRPYYISKYLRKSGYNPEVFCASTLHKTGDQFVDLQGMNSIELIAPNQIRYFFIKTRSYQGNGKTRILNMIDFYRNVKKEAIKRAKTEGKPDIIYASSVHPLTLIAGIKLAKAFNVKCICEIRDLWPESLVAYGMLKKGLISSVLYRVEKTIYKKADKIIMTWPGGYDYIKDKGWEKQIPEEKVICVSNGVDLEEYEINRGNNTYSDEKLTMNYTNYVYTGAIRPVNNIDILVEAAKVLKNQKHDHIRILVYGDGIEKKRLEEKVKNLQLDNILFMGSVKKESIPSLLSQSYATILHNSSTSLDKYGQSQNKFFEYLAAGKPIIMTYSVGHSICKENGCGIEIEEQTPEKIAEALVCFSYLSEKEYMEYCNNARETSKQFDFAVLTNRLINVIEELCK